jgi:hypothetical protein
VFALDALTGALTHQAGVLRRESSQVLCHTVTVTSNEHLLAGLEE